MRLPPLTPPGPSISAEALKERIDLVDLFEAKTGDQLRRVGREWRGPCPKHGGDSRTSFAINREKGLWHCWGCDVGGDAFDLLEWLRGISFVEALQELAGAQGVTVDRTRPATPRPPRVTWRPPPAARPELLEALWSAQDALAGSPGEAYLRDRGVDLDLARRFGIGYAAASAWAGRGWHAGRIVAAHTDPAGNVVNLYGRAAGEVPHAQRDFKHDHLPGAKAIFNAEALSAGEGPLWVCEAVFDALAIAASGVDRVVACFGLGDWRWDWARDVDEIVVAFDADEPGRKASHAFAVAARLRGKRVAILPPEAYAGLKDASEAWAAGDLDLSAYATPIERPRASYATPTRPQGGDEAVVEVIPAPEPETFVEYVATTPTLIISRSEEIAQRRRESMLDDGCPTPCTECGAPALANGTRLCGPCWEAFLASRA